MPRFSAKYKPLYTTDKRYIILTGGRGSGKTFFVQDYLLRLLEQVGQGILYTRYTMTSVEKTIIPLFVKHISEYSNLSYYHITKDRIINKRTNAFIMFSGIKTSSGDQTGNLKSLPNIVTWVIEEGEDYNNEKSFTDIDDSIRSLGIQNRIIWIQNPTTIEHFIYKRFFENNFEYRYINGFKYQHCTHSKVEHIHTTYLDNIKNLNAEKVKEWDDTRINNPKKYENKYIGAWLERSDGVIFSNWETGVFDDTLPYCYGQDYGFSKDPTTLVKIAVDNKRKLMYWHEVFNSYNQMGVDELYEINFNSIDNKNDLIVGDSAELRLIHDLKNKGLNIVPSKKERVVSDIAKLLDYKHIITPESYNIIKEFNNYVWMDKKSNTPIDAYNHNIDSGRYAYNKLTKKSLYNNIGTI